MAGIGFELRKVLNRGNYVNTLAAYGYAGVISSGPWVISILGIVFISILAFRGGWTAGSFLTQFQTSVTYLVAGTLIVSSIGQHGFTRFIADRMFEKKFAMVVPNALGLVFCVSVVGGLLGWLLAYVFLPQGHYIYWALMTSSFVVLCNIWALSNLLSGLKAYKAIVVCFFLGYGLSVVLCYFLRVYDLNGLMLGFLLGQSLLLIMLIILVYDFYPHQKLVAFDFLHRDKAYYSLIASSYFYYIGIWVDKFLFWAFPATSQHVLGNMRASVIYDLPIFLSFLVVIPGLAVFLFRMETDFVEYYDRYYTAMRDGNHLKRIEVLHSQMVQAARDGILFIVKIQALITFVFYMLSPYVLPYLGMQALHIHLFKIDLISANLLLLFLACLNLLFYLDKRIISMWITGAFMVLNGVFTLITLFLGPFYFGYGLALSLLLVDLVAIYILDKTFRHLTYEAFMFSGVAG